MAKLICRCCGSLIKKGQRIVALEFCMGTYDKRVVLNYVPSMMFVSHLDCWARLNMQGFKILKKAEAGEV